MVDPKMLELSVYEGIPHLLLPVVTNPKKASLALKWAVEEMGRRYRMMADKGVRNIDSYNRELLREEKEVAELQANAVVSVEEVEDLIDADEAAIQEFLAKEEQIEHGHLPYIVVIVDELADLMMVAGKDIEESIATARPDGPRCRHPSDSCHPAPIGGCHYRPDQSKLPGPNILPGLLQDRLPDDSRL